LLPRAKRGAVYIDASLFEVRSVGLVNCEYKECPPISDVAKSNERLSMQCRARIESVHGSFCCRDLRL